MGSVGLYTQTREELDCACPYCGDDFEVNEPIRQLQKTGETIQEHVTCKKCNHTHRVHYTAASVRFGDSDNQKFILPCEMWEVSDPDKHPSLRIAAELNADCIVIMAQGYGDTGSTPGYGSPLIIEQSYGKLRACCWTNINSDHPRTTPIIELDGAMEKHRKDGSTVAYVELRDRVGATIAKYDHDSIESAQRMAAEPPFKIPGHSWVVVPVEQPQAK